MSDDEKPNVEQKVKMNIRVKAGDGKEIMFVLKPTGRLGKVFDAVMERWGATKGTYRFTYQGTRLQEDDTPGGLGMEDDDEIDAHVQQIGGDSSPTC